MANSLQQIQAKTVGAAHAVKAGFNGLRGVFLHLAEEHGEVGSLMRRVLKSPDPKVRREHYPQIRRELLAHERGEVTAVYPVLAQHPETRGLALAHDREAEELEAAIAAVDAIDFTAPAWGVAFEHVYNLVQRHVQEEEDEIFPKAQDALGEEESEALLGRYESAKRQVE